MADHADSFSKTQAPAAPKSEQEIVVVAADGKGVSMRRPLEQRLREEKAAADIAALPRP